MILQFEEKLAEQLKGIMGEKGYEYYLEQRRKAYDKILNFLAEVKRIVETAYYSDSEKLERIKKEVEKVDYEFVREYVVERGGRVGTKKAWKNYYTVRTLYPLSEITKPPIGIKKENNYARVYFIVSDKVYQVAYADNNGFRTMFEEVDEEKSKEIMEEYLSYKRMKGMLLR
jgi:hypothetical protein